MAEHRIVAPIIRVRFPVFPRFRGAVQDEHSQQVQKTIRDRIRTCNPLIRSQMLFR